VKVVLTRPRPSVLFDENRRSVRTQIVVTHRALLVLLGDVNLFLLLLLVHLLFLDVFSVRCRRGWCYRGRVMVGHQIFIRLRLRDVLREAHARHDDYTTRERTRQTDRDQNLESSFARVLSVLVVVVLEIEISRSALSFTCYCWCCSCCCCSILKTLLNGYTCPFVRDCHFFNFFFFPYSLITSYTRISFQPHPDSLLKSRILISIIP